MRTLRIALAQINTTVGDLAGNSALIARDMRRARDLGFSLQEIDKLLALYRNRRRASEDVKRLALAHVAELDHKIAELTRIRETLAELARHCHGDHRPECPILEDLEGARS